MPGVPDEIEDRERLVRFLLHPYHYDWRKNRIREKAFVPPPERNDLSVTRLDFSSEQECKRQAFRLAREGRERTADVRFVGFGALVVRQVRAVEGCSIRADGLPENPAHANIRVPFAPNRGEPISGTARKIAGQLAAICRFFPDPDPEGETWTGPTLPEAERLASFPIPP